MHIYMQTHAQRDWETQEDIDTLAYLHQNIDTLTYIHMQVHISTRTFRDIRGHRHTHACTLDIMFYKVTQCMSMHANVFYSYAHILEYRKGLGTQGSTYTLTYKHGHMCTHTHRDSDTPGDTYTPAYMHTCMH